MKTKNLRGVRSGRLTIIVPSHRRGSNGGLVWWCECDCGEFCLVSSGLLFVNTNSCGCLQRDLVGSRSLKHGHAKIASKEYKAWDSMKQRCYNPNSPKYYLYGGRGIKVCDRWLNSFENFLADVGLAPTSQHSIDRFPDNDGNYEPGNVRWGTDYEQRHNQRRVYDRLQKVS